MDKFARHQGKAQHSGTPTCSFPRKLTLRRRRSPSLPNLPSIPSLQELRVDALTRTTPTVNSQAMPMPREPSRRSKLLRSLSLRSVALDDGDRQAAYASSNAENHWSLASSLWPPRWSFSSLKRRKTSVSRNASARTSSTTLEPQNDDEDNDDRTNAHIAAINTGDRIERQPFLPLIRVVSPLTLNSGPSIPLHQSQDQQRPSQYGCDDAWEEVQKSAKAAKASWSNVALELPVRHIAHRSKHKFTLTLDDDNDDINEDDDDDTHDIRTGASSGSTNVLAEVPAPSTSSSPLQFHLPLRFNPEPPPFFPSQRSMSSDSTTRPALTRRSAGFGPQTGVSRRYTFAMAMNDEGITDEALVEELERIRAVRALSSSSVISPASHQASTSTGASGMQDLGDVWDLEDGKTAFDLQFQVNPEGGPSHFLAGDEDAVCDSPTSENSGEAWPPQLSRKLVPNTQTRAIVPTASASTSALSQMSSHEHSSHLPSSASASAASSWHTTRHALLTCRELVRTERHYLSSLISLLSCETSSPPPPLMLHYTAVLVDATRTFVERLERNPTPNGVANAFVVLEPEMEAAYVGWCGNVGTWFTDGDHAKGLANVEKGKAAAEPNHSRKSTLKRLSKSRPSAAEDSVPPKKGVSSWKGGFEPVSAPPVIPSMPISTLTTSDSSSASRSSSSTTSSSSDTTSSESGCTNSSTATSVSTSAAASPFHSKANTPAISPVMSFASSPSKRAGNTASTPPSRSSSFIGPKELLSKNSAPTSQKDETSKALRRPAVRDLAILPTQRVMRYVLLFRDLLSTTSTSSSSWTIVEKATQAADRIAKKCDRAQNNATFIVSPSVALADKDPMAANAATAPATAKFVEGTKLNNHQELKKEGQTLSKKLTKKGGHFRRLSEPHRSLPHDDGASNSKEAQLAGPTNTQQEQTEEDIDGVHLRRRSQSYTNTTQIPRSSSSQRLSMHNLSTTIGSLLGRSSTPEHHRRSHPPSSFSPRAALVGRGSTSSEALATFSVGA